MLRSRSRMRTVNRLNRIGGGGSGAAPSLASRLTTLLGPDASFWLPGPEWFFTDAAKTVRCTDTDLIRVWADGSANGRDLTQATSAARPTARLIGDKWRAVFDGVDDCLDCAFSSADVSHTVFAVASLSAAGVFPMLVTTRVGQRELRSLLDSRQIQIVTDAGVGTATDSTALPIDSHARLVATYEGTSEASTLYRNGVSVASDAADSTVDPPNTITVGCRPGPSLHWPGDIVLVGVVPSSALTSLYVADLDTLLSEVMP